MPEYSDKHKHLEFVQSAINRMSGNLFLLKGWTVTLVAALFALSAKDTNRYFVLIAFLPLVVFWTLDGYFLSQERRFRALYDHVRNVDEADIDFSMDTAPYTKDARYGWLHAMSSRTLLVYYGGLGFILFVLTLFLR